jgi:integrase
MCWWGAQDGEESPPVALPAVSATALKSRRIAQLEERLLAGAAWQDTGLVFTSRTGTALDARNVLRSYYKLLKAAELPHFRLHDLRHACASILLAQNTHVKIVADLLGHSETRLTLDTYSHVIPQLTRGAADAMDALFANE